jgi:mevalonate kinase
LSHATFNSNQEGSNEQIAETLQSLLHEARNLNPEFLTEETGLLVKTHLTFPRDWGLGSSSTLINNIAQWANVDPFVLLWNAFSGSGYDIACAMSDTPILYRLFDEDPKPRFHPCSFDPPFKENLFFVHLNQKQNSREGIQRYREYEQDKKEVIDRISQLSFDALPMETLQDFETLIQEHEQLISSVVGLPSVKERLFPDYFGAIKSLGAWGGDFVLVTGNKSTPEYFQQKGYATILSYSDMVL